MSQTMTVSSQDVGLVLLPPESLLPTYAGELAAYTDFFDWEASREAAEDALDAGITRRVYEAVGVEAFVRVR